MRKITKKLHRRRQMIGLDLAKNVGIYFHYNGKTSYETANRFANYLRNRGMSAMLLAYSDSKEKPTEVDESPNFGVFVKSQLGFNRVPHDDIVNMFVKQPFDIFFDLSLADHFQNLYIANASHATFKVGRTSEWGLKIFDFTLELKDAADMDEFIKNILKYFEVFNQAETAIDFKNI
ncbi:MAG: hypothetical protein LBP96_04985 [Bacteroidales bacterium]|jgi:hypothetical protein|nr:hypothetical protein [Bacteroidales bacterium]